MQQAIHGIRRSQRLITGENRERISPLFDVRAHLGSFEQIAALFSLRYRFQASF